MGSSTRMTPLGRRRRHTLLALAVAVTVLGGVVVGAWAMLPGGTARVVKVTRVEELPRGLRAKGLIGDYLLRNDRIVAVVAAPHPRRGRVDKPGIPIDATVPGGDDRLQELIPSI